MGPSLDHHRHQPGSLVTGQAPPDDRQVRLLPASRIERRGQGAQPPRNLDRRTGWKRQADRQTVDLPLPDRPARHAAQHRPQHLARSHLRQARADPRREARRVEPRSRQGRREPEIGAGRQARRQAPRGGSGSGHGRRPAPLAPAGCASRITQGRPRPQAAEGPHGQTGREVPREDPARGVAGMGDTLRHRPRLAGTLAGGADRLPCRVAGEDGRSRRVHRRQRGLGRAGGQAGDRQGHGARFRAVHDGGRDRGGGRPGPSGRPRTA